jgi:hypothetical protein
MSVHTIDGSRIESREAFWEAYVETVKPQGAAFFGRNFAAFNDALWGGPGWPGDNFVLRITAADQLETQLGVWFMWRLQEVFRNTPGAALELE